MQDRVVEQRDFRFQHSHDVGGASDSDRRLVVDRMHDDVEDAFRGLVWRICSIR